MNIFILTRLDDVDWDEYRSKVIVAKNETRARKIANRDVGNEGHIWENPSRVSCSIIDTSKEAVILTDYKAP